MVRQALTLIRSARKKKNKDFSIFPLFSQAPKTVLWSRNETDQRSEHKGRERNEIIWISTIYICIGDRFLVLATRSAVSLAQITTRVERREENLKSKRTINDIREMSICWGKWSASYRGHFSRGRWAHSLVHGRSSFSFEYSILSLKLQISLLYTRLCKSSRRLKEKYQKSFVDCIIFQNHIFLSDIFFLFVLYDSFFISRAEHTK